MYEFLDHTADIKIRLEAESLDMLFSSASSALFEIIVDKYSTSYSQVFRKEIFSESKDNLLIDFLSEVLYLTQVKHFMPCKIEFHEVCETKVEFSLYVSENDANFIREIKNVTLNDYFIEFRNNRWISEIVFDI